MAEASYYGTPIRFDKIVEIFPNMVPKDGDYFKDFESSLLNSINLDWEGLKEIFVKRANRANQNIEPDDEKTSSKEVKQTSVFAVSIAKALDDSNKPEVLWHQNEVLLKVFDELFIKYGLSVCLKCRNFGHLTKNHKNGVGKLIDKNSPVALLRGLQELCVPFVLAVTPTASSLESSIKFGSWDDFT